MSGFASWGLTILGLAVVMTVAEMLLPNGKLRKVIRSVFATVTALCIITPLPSLLKTAGNKIGDVAFDTESSITDDKYLDFVNDEKCKLIERGAVEYLESHGIKNVGVKVTLDSGGFGVKSATADLSEFSDIGITENGEHINKSEIIRLIAEYLGIGKEAIMTYG